MALLVDIKEHMKEHEENLSKQIFLKDGTIVINASYEYNIALSRCNTAERLLHWIWHLTEKTWMTNDIMRRFIEIACHENKIEMDNA